MAMKGIEHLENLKILDLSENRIAKIEGLQGLFVEELNLEKNYIKMIENLESNKRLVRLNLGHNMLTSVRSIRNISMLPQLNFLVLEGNHFAFQTKYKSTITSLLPNLEILDFQKLKGFSKKVESFFSQNSPLTTEKPVQPRIPKLNLASQKSSSREVKGFDLIQTDKKVDLSRAVLYLKSIYFISSFPTNFIESLVQASEYRLYEKSAKLLLKETIVAKALIIMKGKIVYRSKVYKPGDILFAESLITPMEVKEDVISLVPSEVYWLTKIEYDKKIQQNEKYKIQALEKYHTHSNRLEQSRTKHIPSFSVEVSDFQSFFDSEFELNKLDMSAKVKKDIDDLFRDSQLDPPVEIKASFDSVFENSLVDHETSLEEEAKNYIDNFKLEQSELLGLSRRCFREIMDNLPLNETEDYLTMKSPYENEEEEKIITELTKRQEELREEISTSQVTIRSLLRVSSNVFTPRKVFSFKDILEEADVLRYYDDPTEALEDKYGYKFYVTEIKFLVEEIVELTMLANKYKEFVLETIQALEKKDERRMFEIKEALTREGLLTYDSENSSRIE